MSTPSPTERAVAVELAAVTAGYRGTTVLRDISFKIEPGELVGVVGPSGSGKTTLLRLLTGRADSHAGRTTVFGEPVRRGRAPRRVGYVPQSDLPELDFPLTCEQVVLLGSAATSRTTPWFSRVELARAGRLMTRLGIEPVRRRRIAELSGGQRQRMFLARAMMRDCRVLLLDEPTSGVDLASRREILGLLRELQSEGMTVILTTHDLNWVAAQLPRLICLNGRVVADGPPTNVLTPNVLAQTYGAEVRVVHDGSQIFVADLADVPAARGTDAS